ncbi:MAG: transposase [Thiobacillus sp.]|nr:transposase [Gallionella capsiferriformans]MDZ7584692.1 transposase [Thiobacillus sp.]
MSIAFARWWRMFSPIWTAISPPTTSCLEPTARSVAGAAKSYLHGLYQSTRANMERMVDVVAGSCPQRLHHMLSESAWDRAGVLRQLVADANAHFERGGTALVIDESGFAKKGEHSAGVARQWNGRLGKTDNSQVGVFAALTSRPIQLEHPVCGVVVLLQKKIEQ